jgi:threonine/homoserine/homoserine lactone efflux protein
LDQLNTILAVLLAGLLLSSSPGPSMAYVLSRSVQFGHLGGLASSLGLAVGGLIHALLAALGLAIIVVKFPLLMQVLKYLGALYLSYLAFEALKSAFQKQDLHNSQKTQNKFTQNRILSRHAMWKLFSNGVLIEVSNPKTIIFFLSFMPQFISNHSTIGVFLLSALIPLSAIPADLIAIFAGGLVAKKVNTHYWLLRLINFLVAALLFGIAMYIVLSD